MPLDPTLEFDVIQLPPTQDTPVSNEDVVMSLENVLNITETQYSLSAAIRNQIQGLSWNDLNVLQTTIEVTNLTPNQVVEVMAVTTNELSNLVFLECRMGGYSIFTWPSSLRGKNSLPRLPLLPAPR